MNFLKTASAIIHFFNRQGISNYVDAWIEWREIVLAIYDEEFQSGTINSAINSGKIYSKKLNSLDSINELLKSATENDKSQIVKLLELFKIISVNKANYIPDTYNNSLWNEIILLFSESEKNNAIEDATNWYNLQKEDRFKNIIYVPASLIPISLDFGLRLLVTWLFQLNIINGRFIFNSEEGFFLTIQILIIPIFILVFSFYRDKKIVKNSSGVLSKTGLDNIVLKTENSAWIYLLVFVLTLVGSYLPVLLNFVQIPIALFIFFIPIYGLYLLIIQINFSKTNPEYLQIKEQLEVKEHLELSGNLNSEENDEEIINLEVNLKAENEKMDAYVIEAALFGALAFSGFLQIISVGDMSFEFINKFNSSLFEYLKIIVNVENKPAKVYSDILLSNNGLVLFLSYQSLFCSVFFLSVIASRLRYSKLKDSVDRSLQMAKIYNEKEEILLLNGSDLAERNRVNKKIKELLKSGYKKQKEIAPIMEFMKFFRTLGIASFFVIIVTSGLFISTGFSVILFFISLLSLVYFKLKNLTSTIRHFYITMQEFYFSKGKYINWVSCLILVLSVIMRSFLMPYSNQVFTIGFLLLYLHNMLSLLIPVEFDFDTKTEKDAFGSYIKFQKMLEYVFKIAFSLFLLGYMFKVQHWPGAGPLIVTSVLFMSGYFLFARKLITGPTWLSNLLSISITATLLSILFKIQHWPGAPIFSYISIIFIFISLLFVYLNRNIVRSIMKKTVYVFAFLGVTFFSDYLRYSIWHLSFNYQRYEEYVKENEAENRKEYYVTMFVISSKNGGFADAKSAKDTDSLKVIISNFEKEFLTEISTIRVEFLNEISWNIFENTENELILLAACSWMEKAIAIDNNWIYLDTYASLLYKTKQFEKALPVAEKAYKLGNDSETKKLLEKLKNGN